MILCICTSQEFDFKWFEKKLAYTGIKERGKRLGNLEELNTQRLILKGKSPTVGGSQL